MLFEPNPAHVVQQDAYRDGGLKTETSEQSR
jgi:hypothetical protein